MDDKYDSGTGAAAHSERVDGKENKKETSQQIKRKKSQTRKGRAKKKLIERERIEDWSDNDDYYDDVDELYDDDVDDDETMDDDVLSEKGLNDEETDSIDSWKMTEKPLDESEDFDDEYDDDKLKEQEDLQEEIKQLKGRYENSAIFSGACKLM